VLLDKEESECIRERPSIIELNKQEEYMRDS
jgi:hypothetical protein